MNLLKTLQDKIESLLAHDNPEHLRRDTLAATDPDYMLNSPQVVGYNTTSEQQYIFQNLIGGFDPRSNTILDVACGRADLYGYLSDLYDGNILGYSGIDHNPIMTDLAKQKYDIDIIIGAFETTNLKLHDYVVASGFFTQRRCQTEDEDLQKLFTDVHLMYELANQAVSFNLLSPINNTIHEGFFYVHPGLVMDMLLEKYQYVNIRHNYSKDVYTVTIYKNYLS